MEIKAIYGGDDKIEDLGLVTNNFICYNVDKLPSGKVVDAKFIYSDHVTFYNEDGVLISYPTIVELGEFVFNGQTHSVYPSDDPRVLRYISTIMKNVKEFTPSTDQPN